jgi:hypothetical protein
MCTQRKFVIILSMGILSFLFGCQNRADKAEKEKQTKEIPKAEEITSQLDTASGFNDIFLRIVSEERADSFPDVFHTYVAKGLYKGRVVGLKCKIKAELKAGIVDGKISKAGFAAKGIQLSTIGKESDEFVKALAELYKFPTAKPFTLNPILATVFSLNQNDADLDSKEYLKFKVFFGENSEELYSELFFNINLTKRIIELNEKDQEYRQNIIKVFTR